MAALLRSQGTTVFEENMFENRYRHVDELIRMGADIRVSGRTAVVTGAETLYGRGRPMLRRSVISIEDMKALKGTYGPLGRMSSA